MKYVIDIDEYTYREAITHGGNSGKLVTAVRHGKPLDSVLDEIRAEFISLYPKNYAGGFELGGLSCVFSLYKVFEIIDKYKEEVSEKE